MTTLDEQSAVGLTNKRHNHAQIQGELMKRVDFFSPLPGFDLCEVGQEEVVLKTGKQASRRIMHFALQSLLALFGEKETFSSALKVLLFPLGRRQSVRLSERERDRVRLSISSTWLVKGAPPPSP